MQQLVCNSVRYGVEEQREVVMIILNGTIEGETTIVGGGDGTGQTL